MVRKPRPAEGILDGSAKEKGLEKKSTKWKRGKFSFKILLGIYSAKKH
jgi:rRNA pseudouridine-1189 N-methylase Emg1 (Nep1/Mra1 family)